MTALTEPHNNRMLGKKREGKGGEGERKGGEEGEKSRKGEKRRVVVDVRCVCSSSTCNASATSYLSFSFNSKEATSGVWATLSTSVDVLLLIRTRPSP